MKIEKILAKLRNSPFNATFAELERILNFLGYFCNKKNTGDHFIFSKKNTSQHINIPSNKHKSIKPHYVMKVLKLYDEENKNEKK